MWGLLATTILTSAADSLNPIAITQQFVLQGMVKKPKHIWFFIIPTGTTNLIGGFLAYYGLVAFIGNFFKDIVNKHSTIIFTAELIVGILFMVLVCFLIQNNKIEALKKEVRSIKNNTTSEDENAKDEEEAAKKIKSVSPIALIGLGVGATISELTTALPYFAFLAILFNYQLNFLQVSVILLIYNFIYTLPLMILYFIYVKAKDKFDVLYRVVKTKISKWSGVLVPALSGVGGSFLIYHSISFLVR